MTRDDIIRMAREAFGAPYSSYLEKRSWDINDKQVERFAALVVAAEREACAKFIEHDYVRQFERPWRDDLSAAIRARGKE